MDQAISVYGKRGTACVVEFKPSLNVRDVSLPSNAVLVVANSMVASDKVSTADTNFNLRLLETRLAAAIIAKKLSLDPQCSGSEPVLLYDIYECLDRSFDKCLEMVKQTLSQDAGYTLAQAAEDLDTPLEALIKAHASSFKTLPSRLNLYDRAAHVFSEAQRVSQFQQICKSTDLSDHQKLTEMGQLMNSSQDSCRDLYQCSCPQLDELVALSRYTRVLLLTSYLEISERTEQD